MSLISINPKATDEARRQGAYAGEVFLYTERPSTLALCDHAWTLIREAFDPVDPGQAQDLLPVEKFVEILSGLKTAFCHHPDSKRLVSGVLEDLGCDVGSTYFDLPRLRIVTHSGYLTSGLGYAYQPHRDTWYAAPPSQLNWWMPLTEINGQSTLGLHPEWWERPVPNSSGDFDPYDWNARGRKEASKHVKSDSRNHPVPTVEIGLESAVRLVGRPGSLLAFSAAYLHSTVPNTSGRTRFSVDFRTTHLDDLVNTAGAPNVDNESTGTTLRDFLRAEDFSRLPDEIVALYDLGSKQEGVLVFDPGSA